MPRVERITEVVNGALDLSQLLAKTQEGWKLVAIEWHREVSEESAEPVTVPHSVEEIPYGLRVAQDCHTLEMDPLECPRPSHPKRRSMDDGSCLQHVAEID